MASSPMLLLLFILLLVFVNANPNPTPTPTPTPSPSRITQLWELYKNSSSSSEKIQISDKMRRTLTDMAYVDSRIAMSGLILFGPQMDRSSLRSVRLPMVDDSRCLKSTLKMFKKHCGLTKEQRLKHIRAFANMCNYVADKRAIEEAFRLVCGVNSIESYGIDVKNPIIRVTPTPVRGYPYLCGRASVENISRMEIGNYAKYRRLLFVPSFIIPGDWRNKMVQICLHGNASLGLCQCGKHDWISVGEKLWSPVMTSFEQRFLDVKFLGVESGYLTITLDEESKVWRYVLLAIGNALLLIAPFVSNLFIRYVHVDDGAAQFFVELATRVLSVICIYLSFFDPRLAWVAVCSCHTLHYLRSFIKWDRIRIRIRSLH